MRRIPSLDGLRAISIMMVVVSHACQTRYFPARFHFLTEYGDLGVRVFFVISGYLITHLLLREHTKAGRISLKDFYRRRCYRILPAAIVYTSVMTALYWGQLKRADIAAAFLYVSNYHQSIRPFEHLWSLSVEEQFYLCWPVLLLVCFRFRRGLLISLIAAAPLVRVAFYLIGWRDLYRNFFTLYDSVGMGCLLAVLWPELEQYSRWLRSRWLLALCAVCLACLPWVEYTRLRGIYNAVGPSIAYASIACWLYAAVIEEWSWLNQRFICWLGVLSYSLYLWQQPFLRPMTGVWEWATSFPQNLVLAVISSMVSYYAIERPFLRLRESRKQVPPQRAAAAAV